MIAHLPPHPHTMYGWVAVAGITYAAVCVGMVAWAVRMP